MFQSLKHLSCSLAFDPPGPLGEQELTKEKIILSCQMKLAINKFKKKCVTYVHVDWQIASVTQSSVAHVDWLIAPATQSSVAG